MPNMTFTKSLVLTKLEKNRTEHHKILLEAQAGYKDKLRNELQNRLDALDKGKLVNGFINLQMPLNYIKTYDTAIEMVKNCENTLIELSTTEYSQYMLNEWTWSQQFLVGNSRYSSTAAAMATTDEVND